MQKLTVLLITLFISKAGAQSSALSVADSLYAAGNYSEAITNYEKTDLKNSTILLQIARAYKGQGNKTKSLAYYKESLILKEDQPIAAIEYGRLLLTRAKYKEADTIFSNLVAQYPATPEYHYLLGKAVKGMKVAMDSLDAPKVKAFRKEKLERTESAFAKAVQLDSTHQKALYELALLKLKQNDYPEVEKIAKRALKNDSLDVEITNVLAQNYFNRGYHDDAIVHFEKLVDWGVSSPFIHTKLGYSYEKERLYIKAIEQYEIILAMDEEDYGVHYILADLFRIIGDFERAKHHIDQALYFKDLALDDVYYRMGRIFEATKEHPKAMEAYQSALKENPDNGAALYAVAIAADNYYDDKKEVLRLYERFIEKYGEDRKYWYQIKLANDRIAILKKEIFMDADKG